MCGTLTQNWKITDSLIKKKTRQHWVLCQMDAFVFDINHKPFSGSNKNKKASFWSLMQTGSRMMVWQRQIGAVTHPEKCTMCPSSHSIRSFCPHRKVRKLFSALHRTLIFFFFFHRASPTYARQNKYKWVCLCVFSIVLWSSEPPAGQRHHWSSFSAAAWSSFRELVGGKTH